jgi:hypothetical protein
MKVELTMCDSCKEPIDLNESAGRPPLALKVYDQSYNHGDGDILRTDVVEYCAVCKKEVLDFLSDLHADKVEPPKED